jgi:hypothetical protein
MTFEEWLDACRSILKEKDIDPETLIKAVGMAQWKAQFDAGLSPKDAIEKGTLFYWNE